MVSLLVPSLILLQCFTFLPFIISFHVLIDLPSHSYRTTLFSWTVNPLPHLVDITGFFPLYYLIVKGSRIFLLELLFKSLKSIMLLISIPSLPPAIRVYSCVYMCLKYVLPKYSRLSKKCINVLPFSFSPKTPNVSYIQPRLIPAPYTQVSLHTAVLFMHTALYPFF